MICRPVKHSSGSRSYHPPVGSAVLHPAKEIPSSLLSFIKRQQQLRRGKLKQDSPALQLSPNLCVVQSLNSAELLAPACFHHITEIPLKANSMEARIKTKNKMKLLSFMSYNVIKYFVYYSKIHNDSRK